MNNTSPNTKGFIKTFPYKEGTFVKCKEHGLIGTISCYQGVDSYAELDENGNEVYLVMVGGYKQPWCGEFLLSELEIIEDEDTIQNIINEFKEMDV